jgi:hypothetical protein
MFSLVHFLESFEVEAQVQAFIQVIPELVKQAAEWTAILHARIMNDDDARSVFEERLRFTHDEVIKALGLRLQVTTVASESPA